MTRGVVKYRAEAGCHAAASRRPERQRAAVVSCQPPDTSSRAAPHLTVPLHRGEGVRLPLLGECLVLGRTLVLENVHLRRATTGGARCQEESRVES